jgi:hypothetical protein
MQVDDGAFARLLQHLWDAYVKYVREILTIIYKCSMMKQKKGRL